MGYVLSFLVGVWDLYTESLRRNILLFSTLHSFLLKTTLGLNTLRQKEKGLGGGGGC